MPQQPDRPSIISLESANDIKKKYTVSTVSLWIDPVIGLCQIGFGSSFGEPYVPPDPFIRLPYIYYSPFETFITRILTSIRVLLHVSTSAALVRNTNQDAK